MNEVKDTKEVKESLKIYRRSRKKDILKNTIKEVIIGVCMGLLIISLINLMLQPSNKEYRQYMSNYENLNNKTLSDFNEIIKVKRKGTVYLYKEFRVKYDSDKDEYNLFTIYNPRVSMKFNSKDKVIKVIEIFRNINRDNYTTPKNLMNYIRLMYTKENLTLGGNLVKIDRDVDIRMYDLDSISVYIELLVKGNMVNFVLEKNLLDMFIDDLFSVREYQKSDYISLVTNGTNNEDLKDIINKKEGNNLAYEKPNNVTNDILQKELSLVPNALMKKLSENQILEIVSNSSILEEINKQKIKDGKYTIGGYYDKANNYIMIGDTESNIKWGLLHEVGHAFDSLEKLSINICIRLSYKIGEIFFNDNYAYMNIEEYIAETFVLKMRGLLDENTIINKAYDRVLKKYQ